MDYKRIKDLLDQYFEGNTSVAEETELREFFNNEEQIPAELEYGRALFSFLKEEKIITHKKAINSKKPRYRVLLYISGIAASLFLGIFLTFMNTEPENEIIYAYINGKPITDKNIAAKYSKQALLAVSQNLDHGTKNLDYLSKLNKIETLIKNKQE